MVFYDGFSVVFARTHNRLSRAFLWQEHFKRMRASLCCEQRSNASSQTPISIVLLGDLECMDWRWNNPPQFIRSVQSQCFWPVVHWRTQSLFMVRKQITFPTAKELYTLYTAILTNIRYFLFIIHELLIFLLSINSVVIFYYYCSKYYSVISFNYVLVFNLCKLLYNQ